jgi:hypothetical protein
MPYNINHPKNNRIRALCPLGERLPQLRELRDRLYAQIIDFGDLPENMDDPLLLNLPADQLAWSRTDALLKGESC